MNQSSVAFLLSGMSWPGPSSAVVPSPADVWSSSLPAALGSSSGLLPDDGGSAPMVADSAAAESSGLMTSIMAALALGALLKLARSTAWSEMLSDIYYPPNY